MQPTFPLQASSPCSFYRVFRMSLLALVLGNIVCFELFTFSAPAAWATIEREVEGWRKDGLVSPERREADIVNFAFKYFTTGYGEMRQYYGTPGLELVYRDGRWFRHFSDTPFSGQVVDYVWLPSVLIDEGGWRASSGLAGVALFPRIVAPPVRAKVLTQVLQDGIVLPYSVKEFYPNGWAKSEFKVLDANRNLMEHTSWWPNGWIRSKYYLVNDLREGGATQWFSNGKVESQRNFQKDSLEGLQREYHDNGYLASEVKYTLGKRNGLHTVYHRNGQISTRGNYIDDEPNGVHMSWAESGKAYSEVHYRMGELIGKKQF